MTAPIAGPHTGTRFRLFAQAPRATGRAVPETVYVSPRPGTIGPGPSDGRMYALDTDRKETTGLPRPPGGRIASVARPGLDGHFDHIAVEDRAFRAAHMYGCVRWVLDIWERYLGRIPPWHFEFQCSRLEMCPNVDFENAQLGWGFMEAGYGKAPDGDHRPYALNFDVLAHETGHSLVFGIVGIPMPDRLTLEFRAFHESASDLVALLSTLTFESVIARLLDATRGDIYAENEMNRIGELSESTQIRIASNALKMADVADPATPPFAINGKKMHEMGQPLTGAFFDVFAHFYLEELVARGALSRAHADRIVAASRKVERDSDVADLLGAAYEARPAPFRDALVAARDALGFRLARTWDALSPADLSFGDVARAFLSADRIISGGRNQDAIVACFHWREIFYVSPGKRVRSQRKTAS